MLFRSPQAHGSPRKPRPLDKVLAQASKRSPLAGASAKAAAQLMDIAFRRRKHLLAIGEAFADAQALDRRARLAGAGDLQDAMGGGALEEDEMFEASGGVTQKALDEAKKWRSAAGAIANRIRLAARGLHATWDEELQIRTKHADTLGAELGRASCRERV